MPLRLSEMHRRPKIYIYTYTSSELVCAFKITPCRPNINITDNCIQIYNRYNIVCMNKVY